ncbi:MAG TPA: phosphoribosylamine--glycine ligase [Chloroflexota bacterium]|nr:phosphoribosylamine--glycine ligase [Chloroflexota bacterium]
MRVLVIGSGGREHALCWKIAQSPRCDALFCAPGNGGTAAIAEPVLADDLPAWAADNGIDLAVVGPDDPLAAGLVDRFQARGVRAFGPTRAAAEIEWSKSWAKQFAADHGIPTARWAAFVDADAAHAYVDAHPPGLAVKADGLALGKGVTVCATREEAHQAVDALMRDRVLGAAGARVVIEERLTGREVSAIAVCDGRAYRMLPFACDHKAAYDGDRGPNTGGMGAYSPAPWVSGALADEIARRMIAPAVRGLAAIGRPFVGFLYCGLMVTPAGPRVIEFNARMGDPEAQAILPRLDFDLLEVLDLAVDGRLSEAPDRLPISPWACCCVVLASRNYPASSPTGLPIEGLDRVEPAVHVFHAGTRREGEQLVTAGGRVLGISAVGPTVEAARERAYANAARVRFEGVRYRRDIGAAAVPTAAR